MTLPECVHWRTVAQDIHVLTVVAGLISLVMGFGLGLIAVAQGPRHTGELALNIAISEAHNAAFTGIAVAINTMLGPLLGPALVVLIGLITAWRNRVSAVVLVGVTTVVWLPVGLGKLVFARPRPPTDVVDALLEVTGRDSFPSGHTALAVAVVAGTILALHVSGRRPRWPWVVGGPFVLTVAASRLYLGVHFLADVLSAMLIALGAAGLVGAVIAASIRQICCREPGRRAG